MAITYVTNLSPGAPSFTGAIGSLITVLDFCLVTSAGWQKVLTGTSEATYRAATGNRAYYAVTDNATTNSRIRGFESATVAGVGIANGTAGFPTDVQLSGGLYYYKSTDTTTARAWWFVSDGKTAHFISYFGTNYTGMSFGEFQSFKTADGYNNFVIADGAAATSTALASAAANAYTVATGHFITRSYTQLGGSVTAGKHIDVAKSSAATSIGAAGSVYPEPIQGGLLMSPVWLSESTIGARGRIPGIWAPLHNRPLGIGDTFTGSGDLAGRTFVALNLSTASQILLETSDTWYS